MFSDVMIIIKREQVLEMFVGKRSKAWEVLQDVH
jgi:hypothetical protein